MVATHIDQNEEVDEAGLPDQPAQCHAQSSPLPVSPACPSDAWKRLPARMKVLYITTAARPGRWLAEALAADSAAQVVLEEAVGQAAGLARLRDEVFDAVLVSHEPGELDALDLIEGSRAAGAEEPIVVLGHASEQEMAVLCYEVGAEGYVSIPTTTTRNLIWVVARAVQRHRLARENERFRQVHQTRLEREQDEAGRLLAAEWTLVEHFAPLPPPPFPPELIGQYRELLRAYVIMGNGNLSVELRPLAELLAAAGLTAPQAVQLHLSAVEQLVHGLGARSSRHVMARADLLLLEVVLYLAEDCRRRYEGLAHPPRQRLLPGVT
ncbi:MAG: hypothetical protein ABSF26_31015 [Thermoguttaceae bacterium]